MSDCHCPYCEAAIAICHDDGFGYDESRRHEYECPNCEKNFVFETTFSISHEAFKADCLNGSEHSLFFRKRHPAKFSIVVCKDCDFERAATDAEIEGKEVK